MSKALYVHIPFCNSICGYCDFAKVIYNKELVDKYLSVLEAEIKTHDLSKLKSIYIGGGTPSALDLNQLERLFEILKPYSNDLIEYTIEINPESLDNDKAKLFSLYNINRASVGMQVTQSHLLDLIERKHDLNKTIEAVNVLKSNNINNISIDLMYGIPSQTINEFSESLKEIIKLDITHVSLYALTIEPNTKFARLNYKPADSELDASMYEMAVEYLSKYGFNRYEISNFAKANFESYHNKVYWHYDDFVGVGLHASGKKANIRYTNTRNLHHYLNREFRRKEIVLDKADEMFEFIMMNLRLSSGFEIKSFNDRFNTNFLEYYKDSISKLVDNNLLTVENDCIRASSKGLSLLFNVLEEFME